MKFKRILAALDRSSHSDSVFQRAVSLAQSDQAELLLCHCLAGISSNAIAYTDLYGKPMVNFSAAQQQSQQRAEQEARQWLQAYQAQAQALGVHVEIRCEVGSPSAWLCQTADRWSADLIVIGRRGRRGLTEVLLGSVSSDVVHQAARSVLVVQGDDPETA